MNVDAGNLIPLNPTLPSGVVFKVQICAVRRHVDPETFSGISPVTGEVTTTGLIRYVAGLFVTYEDADAAKNRIRSMGGYNDDFVVAYYNGKRITIAEAMELLKGNNSLSKTYDDVNSSAFFGSGSTTTYNAQTATNTNTNIIPPANTGLNNPVSNLQGFFYSVQVGVYAHAVTPDHLFNITPLYDETMTNGYYRYISGKFQSIRDAVAAKNDVVAKGITDAFVVAYNNGKQISLIEARDIAKTNTTPVNVVTPVVNNTNNDTTSITKKINDTTATTEDKTGIEFKIQIGAFAKDVPIEVVNQLLDLVKGNGLDHVKNDEGLTVYTTGNFKDFRSADDYKESLVENGIKDAFVVAFQHGKRITVTKANELLK